MSSQRKLAKLLFNIFPLSLVLSLGFALGGCSSTSQISSSESKSVLNMAKLIQKDESSQALSGTVNQTLELSPRIHIPTTMIMSSDGEGALYLGNLVLRMFDTLKDGKTYQNQQLTMDLMDLNEDGIRDIIVSGVVRVEDTKGVLPSSYEPITEVYSLNCTTGQFEKLYGQGKHTALISNYDVIKTQCQARSTGLVSVSPF